MHFLKMIKDTLHIIPPKEVPIAENAIEFTAIDVAKTVGVASTAHLYLLMKQILTLLQKRS